MVFTTQIFLFVFLPIAVILYFSVYFLQKIKVFSRFLNRIRALDLITIAISCGFYMWACFDDIIRLFIFVVAVYVFGLILRAKKREGKYISIEGNDGHYKKRMPTGVFYLAAFVGIIVFILFYYKGTYLFTRIWNFIFKDAIKSKSLIAPLGLSFIVFSAISYIVDVYREDTDAGSFIDCALYITFFPKVVSGPIVLWKDFSRQIKNKEVTIANISSGILRVMVGFAKKLILADTFGACIASMGAVIDAPTAWGSGILYMLQIYYDFSGYSDIAIGLSLILGYSFKENFKFPYLSCSITEFWRRWHISLGTWFKEYVYIPLGGNRKGILRTLFNLIIVFVLTGIWHGSIATYLLWGIINGLFVCIEKLLAKNKTYNKTPQAIKWIVTMVIVFLCWQIFRFTSLYEIKNHIFSMLGLADTTRLYYTWQYYFDTRIIVFAIVGAICSTVFGLPKIQATYNKFIQTKIGYVVNFIVILALFVISIMFMVNSKYSPFIYFQY